MNRISVKQLATAFIVTRLLAEMVMVPGELIRYGTDRMWVIFCTKIIMLVLYLPLIFFVRKYPSDTFMSAVMRRSKAFGIILGALFTAVLTAVTVDTVLNLQLYITDTLISNLLLLTGLAIILGAAFYGAIKGVSTVTRTAVFAFAVFAVLIILILITMGDKLNFVYLYPAFIEDTKYFGRALISEISENSEILIFAVLCGNIQKKAEKTIWYYLAIVLVLLEVVTLIYNLILGPYLDAIEYPLYVISSLSDIVVFQRLDGIDAIVWLMCGIIKTALLLASAGTLFKTAAGDKKHNMFLTVYTLFILAVSMFIGSDRRYYDFFENIMNSSLHILFAGFLIPLIALIAGKKRESKENGYEED